MVPNVCFIDYLPFKINSIKKQMFKIFWYFFFFFVYFCLKLLKSIIFQIQYLKGRIQVKHIKLQP